MTVGMALVDFIPVVLFLAAIILLQRDLYECFSKGAFALFAGGGIMVFCAGLFKATWKLLYALNICDFQKLNQVFFPMQATGFLLVGIAMIALLLFPQESKSILHSAAPAVYSGTFVFVTAMVVGIGALCFCLAAIAFRMKKKAAGIVFCVSFVFMLGMGYLSSKDFSQASMHWVAQGVNVVGQGLLLAGTMMLHRAGLAGFQLKKK